MTILNLNQKPIKLSCSEKINEPLMVCSHERSGTHFLMNSIANCTYYTVNPFLNYDYIPLGSIINFFHEGSVNRFFNYISTLKNDQSSSNSSTCVNSILKSHFPLPLLGNNYIGKCKIAYIYRHPAELFISYWKFLHRWNWFEGPKLNSPLELMKAKPSGQSQRYQMQNYSNYFERWANHVISANTACKNSPYIFCINYKNLKNEYKNTIKSVTKNLNIKIINEVTPPKKENYIKGTEKFISEEMESIIYDFCNKEIEKYSDGLPADLLG